MFIISILIIVVIVTLFSEAVEGRASVVMCNSFSCTYNKLCRCTKKEIAVYDNTVLGLCLYHTDSMKTRVIEPVRKGGIANNFTADVVDKAIKDEKLLTDPKAFSKWLRGRIKKD